MVCNVGSLSCLRLKKANKNKAFALLMIYCRTTMGRKKISIQAISDDRNRQVRCTYNITFHSLCCRPLTQDRLLLTRGKLG
jgi:hypothetical protein